MAKEKDEDDSDTKEAEVEAREGDETRRKAEEIGKELGVEKETKEDDAPDYEVEEEREEARLGKDDQQRAEQQRRNDYTDHRKLSNREKRALKKKKVSDGFQQRDRAIAELQAANERLENEIGQLKGRAEAVDWDKINKDYKEHQEKFNAALAEHEAAFKEGDGARATKAMRDLYAHQRAIENIETFANEQKRLAERKRQPQQRQQDPQEKRLADEWSSRNPWFHGAGAGDEDSEIAYAISATLVKQGYRPNTEAYWNELDKRIAKRLPHLQDDAGYDEDAEEEDDTQERREAQRQSGKRQSPPVGGGSNRGDVGGKVTVRLPAAFIQTLKDNGYWEDKKVRDRKIKYFLDHQRQNRS